MASDPQGWDPQGWDPQGIGYQATQRSYAYLNGVSKYAGRPGDTSNLHPEFAGNMARAIQQARAAGLNVGLESAYRTPTQLIGQNNPNASFDAAGNSLHSYGLAADVNGIGPAGSKSAQLWAQIAQQNGLFNPYSANGSEYNHWQGVPFTLNSSQGAGAKAALMKASQSGNFNNVWTAANAYIPGAGSNAPSTYASNISATTSSPAGKFKVPGTTITSTGDAASNPVDYRQSLYQSLIGRGLNPEQARGVLISMMGESGQGLNPGAFNPKDPGGAMGFAQWVGSRRAGLQSTAKALGTTETDPTAQVAYFNSEISGPYAKVIDRVKQAKDAAEANQIWTTGFESPAKDNSAQRFAGNQNAIVIDKSGAPVFSTNAPAAPAATAAPAVAAGTAGPAAGGAPTTALGFKTQAGEDAFLKASKAFQKDTGGKGDAQGQGGQPDVQPSPMIGPPSSAQNVSPLLAMVPMTYGQTINSLQDPLTWNSNPLGRPPPMPQPGAGIGRQGPIGTSLNSLAEIDPNMTPFPQSPISGMGFMGMGYGYPGGGMGYG